MKEQIFDTVALATQDVVATIGHYQDTIASRDFAIGILIVALASVTFLAVRWGMKVYNARKEGVDMSRF